MAARQEDDDRMLMVSSSEPKSENLAYYGGNGEPSSSEPKSAATSSENICKQVIRKFCVGFDKKLRMMIVVLRSVTDFVYILLVASQFRNVHSASAEENNRGFYSIARRYLLSSFAVDILAVLPLPQVVVFAATKDSHFTIAIRTLKFVLVFQYLPRVFRVYLFLKEVRWSSGLFSKSSEPKAIFNLFLYMLASHGFGAFWYLFSIERKAACLEVRCHSHSYCPQSYKNSSIEKSCMDGCSGKASSSDIAAFDFGIFGDAFNSGIVYSTDFMWKFSYCCWWGLQNVSSLGQGLKTSGFIWEIYFAASLTVSGLVLFALLIGNLQTILQAKGARQEELRLKGEEFKQWMTYQKLPHDLRQQIKQFANYRWQKTSGIDIVEIFHNLPRDLRVQTTRHLCYDAIKRVPRFQFASNKFLDAICGCLKPILHSARNSIVSEGLPLEEVIFITKGRLWMYSNSNFNSNFNSNSNWDGEELKEGDHFGEDLIKQAFEHPHSSTIPISTQTLSTRTEVEAFVLSAKDLNNVINKYWWYFSHELSKKPSYNESRKDPNYKEPWAPWAALHVQTKWRCYVIKKHERGKLPSPIESGNSQPSVAKKIHIFGYTIDRLKKVLVEKQNKKNRKRCKDIPGLSNDVV